MEVIVLKPRQRRQQTHQGRQQGPAQVLHLDQLSDRIILRIMKRQAARELEQLHYLVKITGGDPSILPTPQQMEEMENGTIEF